MRNRKLSVTCLFLALCFLTLIQILGITINNYQKLQATTYQNNYKENGTEKVRPTSSSTEETTNSGIDVTTQKLTSKFTYLSQPKNYDENVNNECLKKQDIKQQMIIFVKSAAPNGVYRELLRRTWGSICFIDGVEIKTVFVIGKASEGKQSLINEEYERYGDLLQYNGSDDYINVPLKTLAGMQWAADNLEDSTFYSTVDDDFMINMRELIESVNENIKRVNESNWPEFPIICGYIRALNERPTRDKRYKWYMPIDMYKPSIYPPYCRGGLYTTSVSVVKQLYQISRAEQILPLDDVWITGMLRQKLGMPDRMVVVPQRPAGLHFEGYNGKAKDSVREFMKKDWDELFALFKDKSVICQCDK